MAEPSGVAEDTYRHALRSVANKEFLKTDKYREQQFRADRKGAHVDILDFERLFIRRMRLLGIPMFATEVMRTLTRQELLIAQGKSKIRDARNGRHVKGEAVDIIHGVHGWDMTNKAWNMIGHIGEEVAKQAGIKVSWGGHWAFYDPAHWELVDPVW